MQIEKHLKLIYISFGAVVIIAPLLILFIFVPSFFFPNLLESILDAKPSDVSMVKISPIKKSNMNLIAEKYVIKDPEFIKKLCAELNKSNLDSRRSGMPKWRALITLVKKDEEYQFLLSIDRLGSLIEINTKGEWGWSAGNYRSNKAGMLFEEYLLSKGIIANI